MSRTLLFLPLAAALAAGLSGCLPDTRYRVARFLFDGVPAPEEAARTAQPFTAQEASPPAATDPSVPPAPVFYLHAPYASGDCTLCHDAQSPGQLRKQVKELCLDCHDRGELEAVHGEILDCLDCHDPHKAQDAFLLDFD